VSEKSQVTGEKSAPRGLVAHFLGNILLGLSIGLISYYGITDLVADRAQDALAAELVPLGAIAEAVPDVVEDPDEPTGWEGWRQQDLAYWRDLPFGGIVGRLVMPAIDSDLVVVKGVEREQLQEGPGWITQTSPPGREGNAGISGHRTTYGAPFRRIDELQPGDTVQFYSPFRRYTYEVTEQLIVEPDRVEVLARGEEPMMTLTACEPPYSARFRIVVHMRLTEVLSLEGEVPGA
jgi:LPXTG-site transpeptidase (sortase) family protein